MSSAVATAIYNRLTGIEVLTGAALAAQTALAALLATDPDTGKPAVSRMNKNLAPVVYPIITFRAAGGIPDRTWSDGSGVVDHAYYNLEIWSNDTGGNTLTDIEEQVSALLDMRRPACAALPLPAPDSSHYCWYSEMFVCSEELYDDTINAWFVLIRLKVIEGRF
jgi:hypothetical protein